MDDVPLKYGLICRKRVPTTYMYVKFNDKYSSERETKLRRNYIIYTLRHVGVPRWMLVLLPTLPEQCGDPLSNILRLPSTAYHPPSTIHRLPSTVYHPPSTIHRLPSTAYHPPPTIHRLPSTAYHPPSTTLCLPPSVYHPPSTTLHLQIAIYHPQFTIRFLPFMTVYHLPPIMKIWDNITAASWSKESVPNGSKPVFVSSWELLPKIMWITMYMQNSVG